MNKERKLRIHNITAKAALKFGSALDRVQNKAAKFAHCLGRTKWESLAQRRKTARMCALYKAYTGDRAWKEIRDRLHAPSYLSRVDHNWKIRSRNKERTLGNTPL